MAGTAKTREQLLETATAPFASGKTPSNQDQQDFSASHFHLLDDGPDKIGVDALTDTLWQAGYAGYDDLPETADGRKALSGLVNALLSTLTQYLSDTGDLSANLANTSDPALAAALAAYKHQNGGSFSTGAVATTVQNILDEVFSIDRFGGVGDDSTDSTAAWNNAKALGAVFLPGGIYKTTLTTPPSVEVYGPGALRLNNGDLVHGLGDQEAERGLRLSADRRAVIEDYGLRSIHAPIIQKSTDGTNDIYVVYRHLGGNKWVETVLLNSGSVAGDDTPWKVQTQTLFRVFGYKLIGDATKTVDAGPWIELTSGSPSPYIGHKALQSSTTGDTLTLTFSGAADVLEINLTGRTSGGEATVVVDGGSPQTIDTYNAVDLTSAWTVIARNLGSGSHTITVAVKGTKHASSSGFNVVFSALRWRTSDLLPSDADYYAKPWAPATSYGTFAEVIGPTGTVYYSTAGGTSGSSPPIHGSGTASDGGVSWIATPNPSFDVRRQRIQAPGSEMEYAYQIEPTGQSGFQDVGGIVHGNEYLTSAPTVLLDGEATDLTAGQYYQARDISIVQQIRDYYGTKGAGEINVADALQVHQFVPDRMVVRLELTWLVGGLVGYFYPAMWPLLTYDATTATKTFVDAYSPRARETLADYEGAASAILRNRKDFILEADGRAFVLPGSGGTPSSDNGQIGLKAALCVSADGVDMYRNSNEVNAGIAANLNGGSYSGFSSWITKLYFQRLKTSGVAVAVAENVRSESTYFIKLAPNNLDVSAL